MCVLFPSSSNPPKSTAVVAKFYYSLTFLYLFEDIPEIFLSHKNVQKKNNQQTVGSAVVRFDLRLHAWLSGIVILKGLRVILRTVTSDLRDEESDGKSELIVSTQREIARKKMYHKVDFSSTAQHNT